METSPDENAAATRSTSASASSYQQRIRAVIDTGVARISRYSHRSRLQRLPIEKISQASANQMPTRP